MTSLCPTTGRRGDCPWLELQASRRARLLGWTSAAGLVAGLASGLGFLASLAAPAPAPFAVELLPAPPAAIAALPEPVSPPPEPETEAPKAPEPPRVTEAPKLAAADPAPMVETPSLPEAPAPDSPPAPSVEKPPAKVAQKPDPKPEKKPAEKAAKKTGEKPAKQAKPQAAPQVAAAGQAASPKEIKAWAASVVKQIRRTKRMGGGAKGTVQVGFTVARDGSLAEVQVIASSGDAGLDAMGLDHIRRAAPFAPPPEGASRNLAFAFEMR